MKTKHDTATLTLYINKSFQPIKPGCPFQYTPAFPALSKVSAPHRITLPPQVINVPINVPGGPPVFPILFPGLNVSVKGHKRIPIDFTVKIWPKDFAPVGIAFVKAIKKGVRINSRTFRIMKNNFIICKIDFDAKKLEFTDRCIAGADNCKFEYYVFFVEVKSGRLGVADPGISHDN